jgi:hypothetical protein
MYLHENAHNEVTAGNLASVDTLIWLIISYWSWTQLVGIILYISACLHRHEHTIININSSITNCTQTKYDNIAFNSQNYFQLILIDLITFRE